MMHNHDGSYFLSRVVETDLIRCLYVGVYVRVSAHNMYKCACLFVCLLLCLFACTSACQCVHTCIV